MSDDLPLASDSPPWSCVAEVRRLADKHGLALTDEQATAFAWALMDHWQQGHWYGERYWRLRTT